MNKAELERAVDQQSTAERARHHRGREYRRGRRSRATSGLAAVGSGRDNAVGRQTSPLTDPRGRRWGVVRVKAVSDPVAAEDGYRVLVERTLPIGVHARRSKVDEWARDLAPSEPLERWAANHPRETREFRERYAEELKAAREHVTELRRMLRTQSVTLLTDHGTGPMPDCVRVLGRLLATGRFDGRGARIR